MRRRVGGEGEGRSMEWWRRNRIRGLWRRRGIGILIRLRRGIDGGVGVRGIGREIEIGIEMVEGGMRRMAGMRRGMMIEEIVIGIDTEIAEMIRGGTGTDGTPLEGTRPVVIPLRLVGMEIGEMTGEMIGVVVLETAGGRVMGGAETTAVGQESVGEDQGTGMTIGTIGAGGGGRGVIAETANEGGIGRGALLGGAGAGGGDPPLGCGEVISGATLQVGKRAITDSCA